MSSVLHKVLCCKTAVRAGWSWPCLAHLRPVKKHALIRTFHVRSPRLQEITDASSSEGGEHSARQSPNQRQQQQHPSILFDENGKPIVNAIYLRDACNCVRCVDVSSRQRNYSFAEIPLNIEAKLESVDSDQTSRVRWVNDVPGFDGEHISSYSKSRIRELIECHTPGNQLPAYAPWDTATFKSRGLWVAFGKFMQTEEGLRAALAALQRDGLIFLTNVPSQGSSVSQIAERIGPLRNTFYGMTWDVRSVPNPKNVAYTSKYLGFHMDLLYMTQAPAYQLLHCLQNTCTGGESRFVDTFRAAIIMARRHPDHFEVLCDTSCRFVYINDGHHLFRERRIIQMTTNSQRPRSFPFRQGVPKPRLATRNTLPGYKGVNWSPEFMATPGIVPLDVQRTKHCMDAVKTFAALLEREDLVYQVKMEEGTCVIFANRRVAHARNAFEVTTGQRWLRGAYLDHDVVASKMRVMGVTMANDRHHEGG